MQLLYLKDNIIGVSYWSGASLHCQPYDMLTIHVWYINLHIIEFIYHVYTKEVGVGH